MRLGDYITLNAGGPGSGCHGDNCGRPSTGGKDLTKYTPSSIKQSVLNKAVADWTSTERVSKPLNLLVEKARHESLTGRLSPESVALFTIAEQARKDLLGGGSSHILPCTEQI